MEKGLVDEQRQGIGRQGVVDDSVAMKSQNFSNAWKMKSGDLNHPGIEAIWDFCISVEYDREVLLDGLSEWLGEPEGLEILDPACGTGFPALELHQLGYRVTCTDGSPRMLARFRENAETSGLDIEAKQARWEEVGDLYPEQFDVVMCRGCSFIYAGTYDENVNPSWQALEDSLHSFVKCLRSGGRLYIDLPSEDNLGDGNADWIELEPRTVEGRRIEMRERLSANPEAGIRYWHVELNVDGAPYFLERKSHYMPHAKLMNLFREAGLDEVDRVDVAGESYSVIVGRKR
jgi:SAM-dependent methyltransferase